MFFFLPTMCLSTMWPREFSLTEGGKRGPHLYNNKETFLSFQK